MFNNAPFDVNQILLNSHLSYGKFSGGPYTIRVHLLTFFQCLGNSFHIKSKFLAKCLSGFTYFFNNQIIFHFPHLFP